jgi:hypothetical protein
VSQASFVDPLVYAVFCGHKAANDAVAELIEAGFADDNIFVLAKGDDEAELVQAQFRSGVITLMPWGAVLGILLGVAISWDASLAGAPLFRQLFTGALIGAPLGVMAGAVAGLGHWHHVAEFPREGYDTRPILVGADFASDVREQAARGALGDAGAKQVAICERDDAEAQIQAVQTES